MDKTGQKNEQASKMPGSDSTGTTLESKLKKLKSILDGYGKMTVALSGGVDSAFLLCFAYKKWHDDRIAALTACGPHFAPDETEFTEETALMTAKSNPIGVFLFEDTGALERNGEGLFVGAQGTAAQDAEVLNGYLERSNTDIVKQMTEMITYQRALQSAAQVSKMYDQLMTKATTEIGRM